MTAAECQGHRLILIGASLFLCALFLGLAIPLFAVPRLGLSSHLLAVSQGLYLMIAGLVWPRLNLTEGRLRMAFAALVGGCVAALVGNLLAAILGAGNQLLPLAAGTAHGTRLEELVIAIALRAGGAMLILGTGLFVWGLRAHRWHDSRASASPSS